MTKETDWSWRTQVGRNQAEVDADAELFADMERVMQLATRLVADTADGPKLPNWEWAIADAIYELDLGDRYPSPAGLKRTHTDALKRVRDDAKRAKRAGIRLPAKTGTGG